VKYRSNIVVVAVFVGVVVVAVFVVVVDYRYGGSTPNTTSCTFKVQALRAQHTALHASTTPCSVIGNEK